MELGVKCPKGYISHADCRVCAQDPLHPCGMTPDMLELIRNENSEEPDANSFTPSRLLTVCDRQRVLQAGSDYYVDIEYAFSALRGSAFHALLQQSGRYPGLLGDIREVRLETEIALDGRTAGSRNASLAASMFNVPRSPAHFTGKSDFIGLLRQEGDTIYAKIVDYKTTSYLAASFTDPNADPYTAKHVLQINMYKWLVERALPKALNRDVRVVVEDLELVYFDMKREVRFTSCGDLIAGKRILKAIPIIEDIQDRIVTLIKQKQRALTVLPPVLAEYPAYWACERCSVRKYCDAIEQEGESNEAES